MYCKIKVIFFLLFLMLVGVNAQNDSTLKLNDSINHSVLSDFQKQIANYELQRRVDSVQKAQLESKLLKLNPKDDAQKDKLLQQLKAIQNQEKVRLEQKKSRIDTLRLNAKGYPVVGAMNDTLFYIYAKIGASTASERAKSISAKIDKLYNDDFLNIDSIQVVKSESNFDIIYEDVIIMSVSENDAIWYDTTMKELATNCKNQIKTSIEVAKQEHTLEKLAMRIGLVLLVIFLVWLVMFFIGKAYRKLLIYIESKKDLWSKSLSYKDYTFLSAEQELSIILFFVKILRWFIYIVFLYITLPIIFSIFPFSRTWADTLFLLVWSPFKGLLISVWDYLPKLFSIVVIYIVMKYVIKFVKYIFEEIEAGKLTLNGFHADWAMPTYSIIRFLLYAFMFILIFPYLPGSDSNIFKGVSVFIGVLFSLGSSSAIANMIAGLVITYMRPFKIGDRIKIGDAAGDVVEKTLLVTRILTIKNELITIPNSSVLTGNTTNYSSEALNKGLVIHSNVTIGYDVPWKIMHEVLIESALRTAMIESEPKPFVLQTSLDDFYVSYQINAYTHEASKQALIYSALHQNIQDVCKEKGIEIMSPHYRAERDGNQSTIPS